MTKITKTVYCDLCGKEIKTLPHCSILLGERFTIKSGIFGCKKEVADICDTCKQIIREKRIDAEKKGEQS